MVYRNRGTSDVDRLRDTAEGPDGISDAPGATAPAQKAEATA
jgi:NADH-quinone oxidoreductase subunit K